MANLPNANITITKPLLTCPACEKDIDAETVISFNGAQAIPGVSDKTVNLNGRVVGIKLQHDCTPKTTRGRGRPPGAKNKPKPESTPEASGLEIARSKAEEHRDRLREHEQVVRSSGPQE